MFGEALQQADLGTTILAIVLSRGPFVVAQRGKMSSSESAALAAQVYEGWAERQPPAQLQFFSAPEQGEDLLIYSRPVSGGYLLTLAARPQVGLGQLRAKAELLANRLTMVRGGELATSPPEPIVETADTPSFVLAWRPVNRLPAMMQEPLRQSLEGLVKQNACLLTHLDIRPEVVHLVVTCPPGRSSRWAAYLFKEGSEKEMQQQFELDTELWARGYYGAESAGPLTDVELNLFLEAE
jgi:hypothetical protein